MVPFWLADPETELGKILSPATNCKLQRIEQESQATYLKVSRENYKKRVFAGPNL